MSLIDADTGEVVDRTPALRTSARRSDPQTSHDGAVMAHLPAQRLAVLTALVAIGDCTPWAIVERLHGPESGTVRSRLSQLEHAGLAVKVGTAPGTRGAMNTVWRATDAGAAIVANAEDDA